MIPDARDYKSAAKALLQKGVKNVIVTLGEEGCYFLNQDNEIYMKGIQVTSVDRTGAGDAFISAFVARLLKGEEIRSALEFANFSGAYSVTQQGASSMAEVNTLSSFIRQFTENNP